jgi:phage shock protein E
MSREYWLVLAVVVAGFVLFKILGGSRVSSSVVEERIRSGAKIVDVRTPEEFRSGAYPGAVNIPLQVLGGRLGELRRDEPIVLYCASGMRSASAERILRQAGFTDVVNAGGLSNLPR